MPNHLARPPHSRGIASRILDLPDPVAFVQKLEPAMLHRIILSCGLEDSGEIVALATKDQLQRVFDDDLWKSDRAGGDDQFDAERFGVWIEVLAGMGAKPAAQKLAELDFEFVTAAISRHILVVDRTSFYCGRAAVIMHDDAPQATYESFLYKIVEESFYHDFGGVLAVSRRGEYWDALLSVLIGLEDNHPDFFRRLIARCVQISMEQLDGEDEPSEVVTESEQVMSEVALDREQRRGEQGYIAPFSAAAFLASARQMRVEEMGSPPGLDSATADYLRKRRARPQAASSGQMSGLCDPAGAETARKAAAILEMLEGPGVLPDARRLLPPGSRASREDRLALIRAQLSFAQEHDDLAYLQRMNEAGYLANVLMAGCSFQSRRFQAAEAADAVYSLCNLGLQNWPNHWQPFVRGNRSSGLPENFLVRHDLVTPFKLGLSLIHERVCLHTARRLAAVLSEFACDDREIQCELTELSRRLRTQVKAGTPWLERDNLDVIAILDQPAWAVLLGLLDECPVAPVLTGSSTNGARRLRHSMRREYFSTNNQVLWAHSFVESLPGLLIQ